MKFRIFIVFVFFACCLLPGISLAQNKVVVIPLMSDSDDEIPTVTSAGGRVWMDRNLGALRVAQSVDDYHAYGWLYQWGRLADGHETGHSPTTTSLSADNVPGHDYFIAPVSTPFDWRSSLNNDLWQPGTGLNNPCPAGFRVPTETEWETERASWSSNNAAGAFASPLKLVLAGMRPASGLINNPGIYGYHWSSTFSTSYARYLYLYSGNASFSAGYRLYGMSVRCIKD